MKKKMVLRRVAKAIFGNVAQRLFIRYVDYAVELVIISKCTAEEIVGVFFNN